MISRLTELIARAPWREAVTYRDTWPHEYVLSEEGRSAGVSGGGLRAIPCRGGRGLPLLPYEQHLSVHRRLQILADDPLGRPEVGRGLCAEPGSALPRPAGLRDPARRYRQAGGLSGQPGISKLNHLGVTYG